MCCGKKHLCVQNMCVNFDLNCPQIDSAESWGSESSSSARSTAASSSPQRNHCMASRGPRRPDPAKGKNSPRTNQSHRNRRPPRETATSQAKPPRETNQSVATPRGTQREANWNLATPRDEAPRPDQCQRKVAKPTKQQQVKDAHKPKGPFAPGPTNLAPKWCQHSD